MKKILVLASVLMFFGVSLVYGQGTVAWVYRNDIQYGLRSNGTAILLNGESVSGDIVIPDEIKRGAKIYKVTAVDDFAFFENRHLTSVTLPSTVTSIGRSAFYKCSVLTSITIPDSVTTIGESAFHGCSALNDITIPDSVTTIGSGAFSDCLSLTSVTIPKSVNPLGKKLLTAARLSQPLLFMGLSPTFLSAFFMAAALLGSSPSLVP